MTHYSELKRLAEQVTTDRRFCGDENHQVLAQGVLALIQQNESLRGLYQMHKATETRKMRDLKVENASLKRFEIAYGDWTAKTDWVQETIQGYELGMHRADVLQKRCLDGAAHQQEQADRIKALIAEAESLRKDAERYRWFRHNSLQIVSTARNWVGDLDKEVDTAMAEQAARRARLT